MAPSPSRLPLAGTPAPRTHAEARGLHQAARRGVGGGSVPFPHGEAIRRAFGQHAPEGLRAHLGGGARQAASAMGADAYVWNGRAAFARSPDLHTAAHEAAHIVQQSHGITLPHGIGTAGDRHERLADQVADAVSRGGSAEPLLTSTLGPADCATAAPAGLQMQNQITAHASSDEPTPWKEIKDQLNLDDSKYDIKRKVGEISGAYKTMVNTLKDSCERAVSVTASLDGTRPGAARSSDNTQTAYGNLGNFEEYLTETTPIPNEGFQGGHLISDEILGSDSYVQYNFAPQRASLNAPKYRKIEELAAEGTVAKSLSLMLTKPTSPAWTMKADLDYPTATYTLATSAIKTRLNIPDTAIRKNPVPSTITLTTRVPDRWHATIDSNDPDFVFAGTSTMKTGEAAFNGFLPSEADVDGQRASMSQYLDPPVFWSMDHLSKAPIGEPGIYGTGMLDQRRSTYSWTGTQAVPRKQSGTNPFAYAPLKPQAFTFPTFAQPHTFDEIPAITVNATQMDIDTLKLAQTILTENPTLDIDENIMQMVFKSMFNTRKAKADAAALRLANKKKNTKPGGGVAKKTKKIAKPPKVSLNKVIEDLGATMKKVKTMPRGDEEKYNRAILGLHSVHKNFTGNFFM